MNKGSDAALLPCPFCGDPDAEPACEPIGGEIHHWVVACVACDCEGPYKYSKPEAMSAWNTRALTKVEDTE